MMAPDIDSDDPISASEADPNTQPRIAPDLSASAYKTTQTATLPDAWDQARAYVEAQDYINDENRNAAGNGYVAGWRDRGEAAPADSLAKAAEYVKQEMASAKRCCAECESKFIQSTQYHVEKAFIMGAASTRPAYQDRPAEEARRVFIRESAGGNLTTGWFLNTRDTDDVEFDLGHPGGRWIEFVEVSSDAKKETGDV